MQTQKIRIDRWLWSVRVYKTRTLSTDACKRKWVRINGNEAKPSREIVVGDIVTAKTGPIQRRLKVISLLEKRIAAKHVEDFMDDLTAPEEYEKARNARKHFMPSAFGKRTTKGRPSKKERRDLEDFFFNSFNGEIDT
ncbi:RNA-binding S4 domain-containing protein [Opitutales bacterium]|nr:RNA-binding S4 domain-containing protein [Opitutales bacterium]MDA8990165.1 RNA-binding S4 domain-containing protein [Opitutales bacterium]